MNIKAILKFYLFFVLSITFLGLLSYNTNLKHYFVSVLNAYEETKPKVYALDYDVEKFIQKSDVVFYSNNKNPNIINFRITNNPEKAFAIPGGKGAEVMKFEFKTIDAPFSLKNLNLKLVGVGPKNIENISLFSNEKLLSSGSIIGEYLKFKNINYKLDADEVGEILVLIDLGENLKTNDRIRLDIETPEDIDMEVNNESYYINDYYPIQGKYVTIAKPRPWETIKWIPGKVVSEQVAPAE